MASHYLHHTQKVLEDRLMSPTSPPSTQTEALRTKSTMQYRSVYLHASEKAGQQNCQNYPPTQGHNDKDILRVMSALNQTMLHQQRLPGKEGRKAKHRLLNKFRWNGSQLRENKQHNICVKTFS